MSVQLVPAASQYAICPAPVPPFKHMSPSTPVKAPSAVVPSDTHTVKASKSMYFLKLVLVKASCWIFKGVTATAAVLLFTIVND